MATVPAIPAGASEAATQQAIQSAGLRWAKGADVAPTDKQPAGTFVSSEPPQGSKVPAGSVVTYHLARASSSATPSATNSP
jgi:serine/threonine-protein kinase